VTFRVPEGGMSVWTKFNNESPREIAARARQKGLYIPDGTLYNTFRTDYYSTRLGFASLNFREQEKAISIISDCFRARKFLPNTK
ncbi:MAG TPA: hypothetical protein VFR58_16475, partial [Flavisolibacter sp.]|nr:hypothetical protein [Flavisolibacter sp.]